MNTSVCAVILTYNEEQHIKRCIKSLRNVVEHIYVMDSYSTDNTIEILSKMDNVTILQNRFVNYASQFNFALDSFEIDSDWIIRIDADEYVDEELSRYLTNELSKVENSVNGIYFNRYMKFMGSLLKYGGMSSYWMLRLWRNGYGRCELTWMDEHIVLSEGDTCKAKGKLIDDNLNNLSWWSHKHVNYSTREAVDILLRELSLQNDSLKPKIFGSSAERTRFLKNTYNKIPLFVRPFIYFMFRFFFKLGFLDGKSGFIWAILQGFWYRMLVDAKVYELKKASNGNIKNVIKEKYGLDV
ncbi:glycosyltransferase family 2 protein [Vibrio breoganii]